MTHKPKTVAELKDIMLAARLAYHDFMDSCSRPMTAEEIKERILQTIKRFQADAPVNDDLTLILLKAK